MSKFIFVDSNDRVAYVADTRPTDASGPEWIEIANDSVAETWYYDKSTSTVSQYKPLTIDEIRATRDVLLSKTDWMVLTDSPYQAVGQESNLAAIKTYRQALRDFPDESLSYDESVLFPSLTLS